MTAAGVSNSTVSRSRAASPSRVGKSTMPREAAVPCRPESSASRAMPRASSVPANAKARRQRSAAARPTRGAEPAASLIASRSPLRARRCVIEAIHSAAPAGTSPPIVSEGPTAGPAPVGGSPMPNWICTRPTVIRSPGASGRSETTVSPLTVVPLRLWRSRISQPPGADRISACTRLARSSWRTMSLEGARPSVIRTPAARRTVLSPATGSITCRNNWSADAMPPAADKRTIPASFAPPWVTRSEPLHHDPASAAWRGA